MSRFRLLVGEAWSSIRQNVSTTVASTLTVLIGMVLLGLFIAFFTLVLSWSSHIQKELQVHVYFTGNATHAQENAVGSQLRSDSRVKQVIFISKAQAEATMKKEFPNLYQTPLPSNPLPDSFTVVPVSPNDTPAIGKAISRAHWAGVDDVHWGSVTTSRILKIARWIWITFLVGAILLVIASTMLIANTIRLSIFARRREIEVMKLVGASNWFIRGPFVLEGFVCGVFGSVLAVVILGLGKAIVLPAINWHVTGAHAWPFTFDALALIGGGLLLGAAGSGMTLRRFLQV
ncbi:MAG TPA: permease-like cell division protein FtsX [Gaiellaceae bacterium]|nr:permease-like cell division protein FtsX [Gaiellaceae bacterium]